MFTWINWINKWNFQYHILDTKMCKIPFSRSWSHGSNKPRYQCWTRFKMLFPWIHDNFIRCSQYRYFCLITQLSSYRHTSSYLVKIFYLQSNKYCLEFIRYCLRYKFRRFPTYNLWKQFLGSCLNNKCQNLLIKLQFELLWSLSRNLYVNVCSNACHIIL